ncbi:MAG: ankyrin repeat domain-containing protein [Fibrobacteres bacterium]|jgi:ankyrin repeat protein|nr:ankyrin repeat domain-containing protein [Fibrobacterota bacterium]
MKSRISRGAVLAGVAFTLSACEAKKEPAAAGMTNDMASAIYKDDAVTMKALLDKGESVNAKQNGRTALHMAAEGGKLQVITTLLARNADVNIPDTNGYTPLMYAARACKDSAMVSLISQGAKLESKGDMGITALHLAADKGCLSGIKILIERGADPKATANNGITALAFALNRYWQAPVVVRNDTDVVLFLTGKYGPGADTIKPTAEAYLLQQAEKAAASTKGGKK